MINLINRCWNLDPEKRPNFLEISKELLKEIERQFIEKEINEEEKKVIDIFINEYCKRKANL